METHLDLKTVQQELETLVSARGLGGLGPVDEERYLELCKMEQTLLRGIVVTVRV